MRFVGNCRSSQQSEKSFSSCLTVIELSKAEEYWIKFAQADHFSEDIQHLLSNKSLPKSSCLIPLHPFLDSENVLRVGGREHHSQRVFVQQHPAILHGSHHVRQNSSFTLSIQDCYTRDLLYYSVHFLVVFTSSVGVRSSGQ